MVELRQKATEFALRTVDSQREQFKRYGVWGDWATPYVTLQPEYEAAQLAVFGKMLLNGHIYRGRKPVHWSPSSRTALAEAELEYPEGHKSRSIYVAMPLSAVGPKVCLYAPGAKCIEPFQHYLFSSRCPLPLPHTWTGRHLPSGPPPPGPFPQTSRWPSTISSSTALSRQRWDSNGCGVI